MESYPELEIFKKFRSVIVWGFPLYSHTHSYIHAAWVKTFKHLDIPVYWFHKNDYPKDFDYSNCCFITEGWADENIPINATSTYFVHIAPNPHKYLPNCDRFVEIRYNASEVHDHTYDYVLPRKAIEISDQTLYEIVKDDRAVAKKRERAVKNVPYEVCYMYWATDLLPHEINLSDASAKHENKVHFIGTICENNHPAFEFKRSCESAGIQFIHHDPWKAAVSNEESIRLSKLSYCMPDFRTKIDYGKIGYIPCRVFKAISYGHTGITNSMHVKEVLGDYVEYAETPNEILSIVKKRENDVAWREKAMQYVKENHTFLQRVRDLARILQRPKPE